MVVLSPQLPPIPSVLREQPLKDPSIKPDLEEYLEMQSVDQRAMCSSSDPMLAQRYHLAKRDAEDFTKMLPLLVGEKKSDLLDGHRLSVDNIYDVIAS